MRSRLTSLTRLPLALLVALGLLVQGIAVPPAIPAPAADPFWALGGICGPGHASGDPGIPLSDGHHHDCACCQAGPAVFLLPSPPVAGRPTFTMAAAPAVAPVIPRFGRPRPAYAPRAPPGRS